jgi:hypothetical protein
VEIVSKNDLGDKTIGMVNPVVIGFKTLKEVAGTIQDNLRYKEYQEDKIRARERCLLDCQNKYDRYQWCDHIQIDQEHS